jgi:hypothetical protein
MVIICNDITSSSISCGLIVDSLIKRKREREDGNVLCVSGLVCVFMKIDP